VKRETRNVKRRAPQHPHSPAGRPAGRPVVLDIHVQPRASRTEIVGRHGDAIKIRLRAAPVDGAANDELTRFLAERLGVARHAVRIVAGETARRKRIAVEGAPPDAFDQLLTAS
jgi:uncharacterized protein (TIGR00251 family)